MVIIFLVWKSFMLEYLNYVNDLTDLASITFVHNDIVIRSGSSIKDWAINFVWVIIWGKINFIDTKIKKDSHYITFDIEYFTKNFYANIRFGKGSEVIFWLFHVFEIKAKQRNLNWLILRWLIFVGLGNHAGRTKNEHSTFPYSK